MTPYEINREVGRELASREAFDRARLGLKDDLQRELAKETRFFSQPACNDLQRQILQTEASLSRIDNRVAALRSQLPTGDQVAAATLNAVMLADAAQQAREEAELMLPRLVAALESAETVARAWSEARATASTIEANMKDLQIQYGLPGVPRRGPSTGPSPAEAQYIMNLTILLAALTQGGASNDGLDAALEKFRTERASRQEAPTLTQA